MTIGNDSHETGCARDWRAAAERHRHTTKECEVNFEVDEEEEGNEQEEIFE